MMLILLDFAIDITGTYFNTYKAITPRITLYQKAIAMKNTLLLTMLFLLTVGVSLCAAANSDSQIGIKIRMGGRFDNVRKCVASQPGTKGGIAADISLFAETPLSEKASLHVDLPVMRPILFALAFKMLQFEPSVSWRFTNTNPDTKNGFTYGPMLGFSLHYGPDYTYDAKPDTAKHAFFALGPTIGGYAGYTFSRSSGQPRFSLGVSPYVTPLFSVNDPDKRKGVVIGGLLDAAFYFKRDK